jgi:hypothetical protein
LANACDVLISVLFYEWLPVSYDNLNDTIFLCKRHRLRSNGWHHTMNPSEECRWAGLGGTGQMPAARCVLDISGGMSLRIGDLGRTNRIQLELDAVAAARNSKDVILSFTRMPHAGDCPAPVSFAYSPFVRLITYIIGAPDGVNGCSIIPVVILSSQSIGPIVRMA